MRVAAGTTLVVHAIAAFIAGPAVAAGVIEALSAGIGILLLLGLGTPIAGVLGTLVAGWYALSNVGDVVFYILLAMLCAALALLGPGAWSIDARLFGWKRVQIPDRKRHDPPPF